MLYTLQVFRLFFARHPTPTTMSITITIKPIKVDKNTYRIGKWLVAIEKHSSRSYACGMTKTTTWNTWRAINTETFAVADNKSGNGGIKQAAIKLS